MIGVFLVTSIMVSRLLRACGRAIMCTAVLTSSIIIAQPAHAAPDLSDPIPSAIDESALEALKGVPQPYGRLVRFYVPDIISQFPHRSEYVYLPPAWFATNPPPELPAVMMIAGWGDSPEYWARTGRGVQIAADFAEAHGGNSPIMVFVDAGGYFNSDTECVNGPRGNVEDHLVKEVPPFVSEHFLASPRPENWGIVGWSMGGTCAAFLAVLHPDQFSGFVDIVGYLRPSLAEGEDTLGGLFGGNKEEYDLHDTLAAMTRHGLYGRTAGWIQVTGHPGKKHEVRSDGDDKVWIDVESTDAARALCDRAREVAIACAGYVSPGRHLWPYAREVFAEALPWLAGYIHTPGVPEIYLPPSNL